MRKFFGVALAVAGAFLFVPAAHAQFTTVTATVKDPNGIPYVGGTMSAVLVPGSPGGYTLNGAPYSGRVGPVTLDGTGKFIANFGDVTLISPGSPQWLITINSNQGGIEPPLGTGGQTFVFTSTGTTISGSSPVDISASLNALAPKLTNFAGSGSGTVTSITATSPVVVTPSPLVATGVISCPTCNTSSATIAGTIAVNQVAFGTAPNTIGGSANLTYTTGTQFLELLSTTGSGSFLGLPAAFHINDGAAPTWNIALTKTGAPAGAAMTLGADASGNGFVTNTGDGTLNTASQMEFEVNGDLFLTAATVAGETLTLLHGGGASLANAPFTIGSNFNYTDVAGTQNLILGTGVNGNLDIRVSSAATHFIGPTVVGADTMDFQVHSVPLISATTTNGTTDQSVSVLQQQAGAGNFVFTSDLITANGATSGAATITFPAVAGTITNPIVFSNAIQSLSNISTGPDGVHPGNVSFVGNTTAVTPAANTFNIMGPSTAAFTAYALQFSSTAPTTGQCMVIGTVSAAVAPVNFQACTSGAALSAITAATGSNTIANGNNPQTWNWAQTTDAQDGMAFGETSAATGGTLTGFLANQALHSISTLTASTETPLEIVQGSVTGTVAFPAFQIETTWNNAGLTGQGIVFNVTNTASAAGSLLLNLLVGGATQFSVNKNGQILVPNGTLAAPSYAFSTNAGTGFSYSTVGPSIVQTFGGTANAAFNNNVGFNLIGASYFGWAASTDPTINCDTCFERVSAAVAALGGYGTKTGTLQLASIMSLGTKFTAVGCTNSATLGGATAGQFTSGTTGACTVTITMGNSVTAPNGWACWASDQTTPGNIYDQKTGGSTTTAVLSGTTASGDVISFGCVGY
jgi:hypothetical protein